MGEKDFLVINGLYKSYGEGESKQEVLKDLKVIDKGHQKGEQVYLAHLFIS